MTAIDAGTDVGRLRQLINDTAAAERCAMTDLTVLAAANDPFRVDTPARRRDGAWLAAAIVDLNLRDRQIHTRGIHYALIGRPKPDGLPYTNTEADWAWLSEDCAKAARWLGYVPFDRIIDARNTPPTVTEYSHPEPWPYISVGLDVTIPDASDLQPHVGIQGFTGVQPYKLVLFGEKSSLSEVLTPFAREHQADLYLMTGEISDTLLHRMATVAAADPRPMVVLTFSDADPAGWQMPISIARKLQAFKALGYGFDFQVHRVALTPSQVRAYGLPSTPLKETEQRADRWRAAMHVDQTEIDALAQLRPGLLRELAEAAVAPFYDPTLTRRVNQAEREWRAAAQQAVDERLDGEHLYHLQANAARVLAGLQAEIDALNDAARVDADDFDLPPVEIPPPEITAVAGQPLIDSSWPFAEQTRRLKAAKAYTGGAL